MKNPYILTSYDSRVELAGPFETEQEARSWAQDILVPGNWIFLMLEEEDIYRGKKSEGEDMEHAAALFVHPQGKSMTKLMRKMRVEVERDGEVRQLSAVQAADELKTTVLEIAQAMMQRGTLRFPGGVTVRDTKWRELQ